MTEAINPTADEDRVSAASSIAADVLTNDESTWTNALPASQSDQDLLTDHYVPRLCNAYIYEREGGQTEVTLYVTGDSFRIDNVTTDSGLMENKASSNANVGELTQLSGYLRYLDENGGSLDYNFFRSPFSGMGGPDSQFASALADAATRYDLGIHVYDYDWWEELQ